MIPVRIAKLALGVYAILLFVTHALLLAEPGRRVPIYAFLGIIACVPVACDSRTLRLWSLTAIVLAMGLIIYDYQAGLRFQRHIRAVERQIPVSSVSTASPATPGSRSPARTRQAVRAREAD